MLPHLLYQLTGGGITVQCRAAQHFSGQRLPLRNDQELSGHFQYMMQTNFSFQTAVITAVAGFALRVYLCVTDFRRAVTAGMQQCTVGNNRSTDIFINHQLNNIPALFRRTKKIFRQRPGRNTMLEEYRHPGMLIKNLCYR